MKKIISVFIVLVLLVSTLAACKNETENDSVPEQSGTPVSEAESSAEDISAEESSEQSGEESGAEPENGAYICEDDRFPGKQAIKMINNDSLIFVIDEELFRITGEDGTEAAAYGGRSFLCKGETETALEYESAILCGNQLFLHELKPEKIGENLAYCFYRDNSYDASIYFVEDSHVMRLPCNGAPKVRKGVDNVFFMSENDMLNFAEWIVMGKDGKLRSLPAFDGKRYIIKSVEYASDEGGGVDVTAYRWNADDLAYEEFSFAADINDCVSAGPEYYFYEIEEIQGMSHYTSSLPELDREMMPEGKEYFELDALPGYELIRVEEYELDNGGDKDPDAFAFMQLGKELEPCVWYRDGAEYTARSYTAVFHLIRDGNHLIEPCTAVLCEGSAKKWGYGDTLKYHNIFISSEFDESDGRIYMSYVPAGTSGKSGIVYHDYLETDFRDNSGYFLVQADEDNNGSSSFVVDWQGNTYSLDGDGKLINGYRIYFDAESEDPDSVILEGDSWHETYKASLADFHRDLYCNYDLISADESGVTPEFPGKETVSAAKDGEYPFYVIDTELFTLDWNGKTARGFEGKYVELAGGKIVTSACYGVLCDGKICRFNHKGARLYALGKLAIYEDSARSTGYVVTGCGEYFTKYLFEKIRVKEGSDYVILYDNTKWTRDWRPSAMVIGLDGKVRALPVQDDDRWNVNYLEFDPESDDPNAVVVHSFTVFYWLRHNPKYPTGIEAEPFKANLKDAKETEYSEYYRHIPYEWLEDS